MVLVRFEPLNPLTPDPDFGNLFCVAWQIIGELQFLVSMFPVTHSEFERARFFFAGELLRSCIVHDLVFRQGIGGIPCGGPFCCDKLLRISYGRPGCLSGNSTLESFETS